MQTKILEVRDRATFFPVIAVDMNPDVPNTRDSDAQRFLLRRLGYPCDGRPNIAIANANANGGPLWNDYYGWKDRTYAVAHKYIIENWSSLQDGDVIDCEWILHETTEKKVSERFDHGGREAQG